MTDTCPSCGHPAGQGPAVCITCGEWNAARGAAGIPPALVQPAPPMTGKASALAKSLDQFAVFFAVLGILGAVGLGFAGFSALGEIQGSAWPFFLGALAVAFQCGWCYMISAALAELLRRQG